MLAGIVLNIAFVICFAVALWANLTKQRTYSSTILMYVFGACVVVSWIKLFDVANKHGLL